MLRGKQRVRNACNALHIFVFDLKLDSLTSYREMCNACYALMGALLVAATGTCRAVSNTFAMNACSLPPGGISGAGGRVESPRPHVILQNMRRKPAADAQAPGTALA